MCCRRVGFGRMQEGKKRKRQREEEENRALESSKTAEQGFKQAEINKRSMKTMKIDEKR